MNADGFWQARPDTSSSLDHTEGAIGKAETSHGGVFDFDAIMGEGGSESGNAVNRPHEPLQQIDVMDGLVHERAAAIEGLGAFPATFVVILLRAPPFDRGFGEPQPAEAPLIHGLLARS